MILKAARPRPLAQQGSLSVWLAVAMPAFIIAVGLGVDLSGHALAEQDARQVAAQAARSGGQRIVFNPAGQPVLDRAAAIAAATNYAGRSGYQVSVTIVGERVRVSVRRTYDTQFLGLIGVGSLAVEGEATSQTASVLNGEPN